MQQLARKKVSKTLHALKGLYVRENITYLKPMLVIPASSPKIEVACSKEKWESQHTYNQDHSCPAQVRLSKNPSQFMKPG